MDLYDENKNCIGRLFSLPNYVEIYDGKNKRLGFIHIPSVLKVNIDEEVNSKEESLSEKIKEVVKKTLPRKKPIQKGIQKPSKSIFEKGRDNFSTFIKNHSMAIKAAYKLKHGTEEHGMKMASFVWGQMTKEEKSKIKVPPRLLLKPPVSK